MSDIVPGWQSARPFVTGGTSAIMATCCIQPIDMVKVRIQLQETGKGIKINTNPISVATTIIKEDGFLSLYRGLSAGILRQMTYGMTRLGVFKTLEEHLKVDGTLSFSNKLLASLCAGGTGALIGTPADAALVRMQADTMVPLAERRGYKNGVDAMVRMAREEGLKGFFSGAAPTVYRGLAMNVGMLVSYGYYQKLVEPVLGKDTQANRFGAGALSGWTASTMSLPFDFVKTRLQKQKPNADGSVQYKGFVDCARQVVAKEGILALYQGYMTYVVRITPHIMLTWVFLDNINAIAFLK